MTDYTDREIELMTRLKSCLQKEQDRAIFTVIGIALSACAHTEEALVSIAATLLRCDPRKAGLVMYSIINFGTWLSIIDELFEVDELFNAHKPRWNKINKRLRGVKEIRDRMAHHTALSDGISASAVLAPARFDTRTKSQSHPPLGTDQVYDFIEQLTKLNDDLKPFIDSMTQLLLSSQHKPNEPIPDPHPS